MARFAYWKLPQGFKGSLKNFTVFFVVSMCFNEGGDKRSRFQIHSVSSQLVFVFALLEELEMMIFDICLSYKMVFA